MSLMSDSMPFTEWESLQLEKRGQLWRDLFVAKTETWYGQRKKDLKNSTTYQDAYVTQNYAKVIQQERCTLIKSMKKGRALGLDCKVIDRRLFVCEERFTCGTILEYLKESPMETEITM